MAVFTYQALEDTGRRLQGTVEAPNFDAAVATVSAKGIHLLEIEEKAAGAVANTIAAASAKRISRSELALFTRRLADLASAGLPLDRALRVAGEQSGNSTLSSITHEAVQDVHAGLPVSEALAKYPKLFPDVFTMTLRAGEASGQFPEVASRLAEFQQTEVRRRAQITGALVYPAILLVSSLGVVAFMELFVVPRLSGVFKDLGTELPISTRMLLLASDFVMAKWIWIAIGIVASIMLLRAWMATTTGVVARDRWLLRAPLLGPIVAKAVVSRYARVLGTLLYGGVPILESLQIAGAASGNRVFQKGTAKVQQDVREGRRIADSMRESEGFSDILVQMVAVGEETGDLPRMLGRVSETLDFEVDNGMQKLTTLIEPLIVLTMGAFVGFVVLSILLPVYQAQELIK
jgi:general secretion pathway protein F/type IV pilus assembly protein PilC